MATYIFEVEDYLHSIAPNYLQEGYDNAGLIVGNSKDVIKGVLISLDCTEQIIDEAIALGANLVVCHHPIVFRGIKRFNGSTYVERTVMKAIKHDIAIFAIHTNLDNVMPGVNGEIANRLGLVQCKILRAKDGDELIGAGIIGDLPQPINTLDFFGQLKLNMNLQSFKYTEICHQTVQKIAVCGGAGSFLLEDAKEQGAEVFITSDFKYHEFFDAESKIIIVDIGHYESEKYTIDLLYTLISNKFSNFAAHYTRYNTNPVKYF